MAFSGHRTAPFDIRTGAGTLPPVAADPLRLKPIVEQPVVRPTVEYPVVRPTVHQPSVSPTVEHPVIRPTVERVLETRPEAPLPRPKPEHVERALKQFLETPFLNLQARLQSQVEGGRGGLVRPHRSPDLVEGLVAGRDVQPLPVLPSPLADTPLPAPDGDLQRALDLADRINREFGPRVKLDTTEFDRNAEATKQARAELKEPVTARARLDSSEFLSGLREIEGAADATARRINAKLGSLRAARPGAGDGGDFGSVTRSQFAPVSGRT